MQNKIFLVIFLSAASVFGQEKADSQAVLSQILQRLDMLEQQNRELIKQIQALEAQIKASSRPEAAAQENAAPPEENQPPLDERVTVNERRITEQAQSKVEASQKFPISLDGMLLFNAFGNSGQSPAEATEYGLVAGPATFGGTLRQTILGLRFQGPSLPGGGQVHGSVTMDFWAGYSEPGNNWLRLRRADLSFDWQNRSFMIGQEKPLISPYEPDSLAEVAVPPLAGAGNLWLWLPQARYEERLHLGTNTTLTGQVALMQTAEYYGTVPAEYSNSLELARPAVEERVALSHKFDDVRQIQLGAGFHLSATHVANSSVASHIASLDWRIVPFSKLTFTGSAFQGQNVAGLGALGNGFAILPNGSVRPVRSSGGWTQFSVPVTSRLTFNLFSGIEDDRARDLITADIVRNLTYASNFMYHLGPNVVLSLEALQIRAHPLSGAAETHNHYDLAVGYLF